MMSRWFRNRAGEEKGAVLVLVSVAMVALIGATALAVDVGQVTNNNRSLQAKADVIAMDAVRAVSGATAASLSGATGAVVTAAQGSATRNNLSLTRLTVDLGTLSGTTFTVMATPILNGVVQAVTSTAVPSAVRVTASGTVNFAFQPGTKTTNRSAIAIREAKAGFSIGSWLASIPAGGDGVLNAVLGDAFNLNAVSYNGLVSGNVTLEQIGLNMPVTALSPTQLLNTSVNISDFMVASIAALNAQGNTAAVNVLNSMVASASLTGQVKLGEFIDVAAGGETAAANASLNLLQLLTASAFVLHKESGHAIEIPTSTISIPGIASVTASATVIEPQKYYFGPAPGPTPALETAQVRLSVTPVINTSTGTANTACTISLSNVLGLLGCLLNPLLPVGVSINGSLPLDITAAGATATLAAINCATPSITVNSTTQAVNLNTAINLALNVTLAGTPFLNAARVNIAAGVKTTPVNSVTTFNYPSEFWPTLSKSVGSNALGLNGLLNISSANVSVLNGLLNTAAVSGVISTLVVPVLNTLLSSLDSALIVPLTKTLGVKLGGADIAATGIDCNGMRLAG
jgi:uncharacterized membrane protein